MSITAITRTVYRAPTAGRCYMTLRAACASEARAILKAKYPNEHTEYDEQGHITYPGFSWESLPRSDVLYRRMTRLIRAAYEATKKGEGNG